VAAPGLAPLVAAECAALGLPVGEVSAGGVALSLPPEGVFRLNLWSRLATRVLVRVGGFPARDFATLARRSAALPWGRFVPGGARVGVRVTCRKSRLYHSDAVAERVAHGITQQVRGASVMAGRDDEREAGEDLLAGDAPPDTLVVVRVEHDVCTVSVDSSGALLHRRGWRQAVAKAPLRETLAAALLAACRWDGRVPLVDPLGGSGTIAIEAALLARGMAPGAGRAAFAMERWPLLADASWAGQWAAARAEAAAMARPSAGVPIVVRDRDAGACAAARANADRAGVADDVLVEEGALSTTELSRWGARGLLLTNPPYGLRVGDGGTLRGLYARLGEVVRAGGDWEGALLVPDPRMGAATGLRLRPVLRTSNGGIPVTLVHTL
jgi:putative N6-adenine-specific DNA methylase